MLFLLPLLAPVLRRLSIRRRTIVGLPLLVAGLGLVFGSSGVVAVFILGVVLASVGLMFALSALLRRPRPQYRVPEVVERAV